MGWGEGGRRNGQDKIILLLNDYSDGPDFVVAIVLVVIVFVVVFVVLLDVFST